jgi:hypothetical protein
MCTELRRDHGERGVGVLRKEEGALSSGKRKSQVRTGIQGKQDWKLNLREIIGEGEYLGNEKEYRLDCGEIMGNVRGSRRRK